MLIASATELAAALDVNHNGLAQQNTGIYILASGVIASLVTLFGVALTNHHQRKLEADRQSENAAARRDQDEVDYRLAARMIYGELLEGWATMSRVWDKGSSRIPYGGKTPSANLRWTEFASTLATGDELPWRTCLAAHVGLVDFLHNYSIVAGAEMRPLGDELEATLRSSTGTALVFVERALMTLAPIADAKPIEATPGIEEFGEVDDQEPET